LFHVPVMPGEYQYPFELRHLAYFREVARQLHFRKAAETLAVAQPALSRSVAQLEAALGVDLLNRTRRKVELTPVGRAFLERIEPLLRGLAAVPADIQALAGGQAGQVRVAFTGLAMATVLPGILREFNRRYPGIRVELNESPTSAQLNSPSRPARSPAVFFIRMPPRLRGWPRGCSCRKTTACCCLPTIRKPARKGSACATSPARPS
jgi:DNA-binding transcriptional LysR family regulator